METRPSSHPEARSSAFELVTHAPAAPLRAHVLSYEGYAETADRVVYDRRMPSGAVPMIIGFGAPMRSAGPGTRGAAKFEQAFVAGLHDTHTTSEWSGVSRGVQVNMTPIGAHLLLGVPMDSITDRVVALDDVFGAAGRDLAEHMQHATTWEARFAAVDDLLTARMAASRARPTEGTAWAWQRLNATQGRTSIAALTEALGCSRKHLVAQFREQIGLPPKMVARILRFTRARTLAERASGESWIEIAQRSGYYDQAHLIRDFTEFAGITPGAYKPGRTPDGRLTDPRFDAPSGR